MLEEVIDYFVITLATWFVIGVVTFAINLIVVVF